MPSDITHLRHSARFHIRTDPNHSSVQLPVLAAQERPTVNIANDTVKSMKAFEDRYRSRYGGGEGSPGESHNPSLWTHIEVELVAKATLFSYRNIVTRTVNAK